MSDHPILYTVQGAVQASGFSRTRVYMLLGDGKITAVKEGRRLLIVGESLRGYIGAIKQANIKPARV